MARGHVVFAAACFTSASPAAAVPSPGPQWPLDQRLAWSKPQTPSQLAAARVIAPAASKHTRRRVRLFNGVNQRVHGLSALAHRRHTRTRRHDTAAINGTYPDISIGAEIKEEHILLNLTKRIVLIRRSARVVAVSLRDVAVVCYTLAELERYRPCPTYIDMAMSALHHEGPGHQESSRCRNRRDAHLRAHHRWETRGAASCRSTV